MRWYHLALAGVVADGDGVLALHDAAEPVEVGRAPRHAPVAEALVLGPEVGGSYGRVL